MDTKQLEQALSILTQVVDAATANGIFKKAQEASVVAKALEIVTTYCLPEEKEQAESAPTRKLKKSK